MVVEVETVVVFEVVWAVVADVETVVFEVVCAVVVVVMPVGGTVIGAVVVVVIIGASVVPTPITPHPMRAPEFPVLR